MSETTPSRPSLVTFLHRKPAPAQPEPAAADVAAAEHATGEAAMTPADPPPTAGSDHEPTALDAPRNAPSFLRRSPATPSLRHTPRWQWAALAGLAMLLALQVVVADRARLAANADWRPLLGGLCGALRCTLPAWHQPDAFTMLQRDIRPLAGRQGVLQVQASFRNDARWAQAWPGLQLSLADADGRVIGRRTLQPGDYLGPAHDPQQRLEPGQSAQVSFLLREPSATTVAYTFEFR